MSDVTRILSLLESGDGAAAEQLLPVVYDELRKLAAAKLAQEKPGQTLQATALVHEAYLRLVGSANPAPAWDNRGHFFAAAAEAMRRILVEKARSKGRLRHGAQQVRHDVNEIEISVPAQSADILALDEALQKLEAINEPAARLVKLRFFAGLTGKEAAHAIGVSARKADQIWAYARAWLLAELEGPD